MFEPIFPGMDPSIEGQRWVEFHSLMIARLQNELARLLVPQYDVRAESHMLRPDVSIHRGKSGTEPLEQSSAVITPASRTITPTLTEPDEQQRIEIRDEAGKLVTVLELLSPANTSSHQKRRI